MVLISEGISAAISTLSKKCSGYTSSYEERDFYKNLISITTSYFSNIKQQVEELEKENAKLRLEIQSAKIQLASANIIPNDIKVI